MFQRRLRSATSKYSRYASYILSRIADESFIRWGPHLRTIRARESNDAVPARIAQMTASRVRRKIRSAGSDAQRPSQKFSIVVVSRARMAQTTLVEPAIGDRVIERQAGVVHRPGPPRCRRLCELATAVAARKTEPGTAGTRSRAIESLDLELVAFPRRTFRDPGLRLA